MSDKKFSEFTLQTDNSNVAFVVGFNGSDNVRISPSNLIGSGFLATSGGTMTGNLLLQDNIQLQVGTGADLKLYHNATDSFIENQTGILKIQSSVVDGDISFLADNGSGTPTEYFRLDGGLGITLFSENVRWADNKYAYFGDGNDMQIRHAGTSSEISNYTGSLTIRNLADDQDIIFQTDDGSGGTTAYLTLDGSAEKILMHKSTVFSGGGMDYGVDGTGADVIFYGDTSGRDMKWDQSEDHLLFKDNTTLKLGTGGDLEINHDGNDSFITARTTDLKIQQLEDDKDIRFLCDDGSGGVTEYFRVDGGLTLSVASKHIRFEDSVEARFGTGGDARIFHDATDTYFDNFTGDLYIRNSADDKDIIFQSDDGSGGVETYFFLDGSSSKTVFPDNKQIQIGGGGGDGYIYSDGTNMWIQGNNPSGNINIYQGGDDGDIRFYSDDGSGGVTEYFRVDGGAVNNIFSKNTKFGDSVEILVGDGNDLHIYHNGSDSYVSNDTGDLYIRNSADDKDVILQSDDGSGGLANYIVIAGAETLTSFQKNTRHNDSIEARFGTGSDLRIYHNGTNSNIENFAGTLQIIQNLDDGDISFKSDDGSGGTTEYFRVDGSSVLNIFSKDIRLLDSVRLNMGDQNDLHLRHNGTNAFMTNSTGDLTITNEADDKDIIFQADDGSGGTTEYFRLDGSVAGFTTFPDNTTLAVGTDRDFRITHDGTDTNIFGVTGDIVFTNYADDKDIVFRSDDGSGGVETYFLLDGSANSDGKPRTIFPDNAILALGTSQDFTMQHNATNTELVNVTGNLNIKNSATDGDISFFGDNGSGGTTEYFRVDGGNAKSTFSRNYQALDSVKAQFGDSNDLEIYHDGSNSYISDTGTGDLKILGETNIYIGAATGGANMAQFIKGGAVKLRFNDSNKFETTSSGVSVTGDINLGDSSYLYIGASNDLQLYHDGTDSYVSNTQNEGDLIIQNGGNDKDIIFKCDDGSGGTTAYLTLDGGLGYTTSQKRIRIVDAEPLELGSSGDMQIFHNSTDSFIDNYTGDLTIRNRQDDGDIVFTSDDGSGGLTEYFRLDGALGYTVTSKHILFNDSVKARFGNSADLEIYHDGSNSYIDETGTGSLYVRASDTVYIQKSDGSSAMAQFTAGGGSYLYHNNNLKFGTTSSGVDVTGRMDINDGNNNVSIGDNAGDALTTGVDNTALGYNALTSAQEDGRNTAIGRGTLATQNGAGTAYNTAVGYHAGAAITTATANTLLGGLAGDAITTGFGNVAIGYNALSAEDTGGTNVAIGHAALQVLDTGSNSYSVAIGYDAGKAITTGVKNTIIGGDAGKSLTTGEKNVAVGYLALSNEDANGFNVAVGVDALRDLNAGADAYNVAVGASAGATMSTGRYNNLIGAFAGDALTTGWSNTAIGYLALTTEDTGSDSVAIGRSALQNQNYNGSAYNIAIGRDAGKNVTTGIENVLIGGSAGDALTTGQYNIAMGKGALSTEDTGSRNTAIGHAALFSLNYDGDGYNTALGFWAGLSVTTGVQNTLIGGLAGDALTTGMNNVAIGYNALGAEDAGSANVAIGAHALEDQDAGTAYNTAVGHAAGRNVTTGVQNTILGGLAGDAITDGDANIVIGYDSGGVLTEGGQNTLVGDQAAGALTTGDENTYIGRRSGSNATTGSNNLSIGAGSSLSSATVSNEANIFNGSVVARFQGAASAWTFVSDERDKKDIEDLELGLDFIDKLKPRKFKWDLRDSDTDKGKESSGFIAQEIKEVLDETGVDYTGIVDTNNPDQYTVAQANIIPMLVKAIQELKQEVQQLKNK